MSIERVREYLKQFGKDNSIIEMDKSTATVPLAARALGTEEARIAKSLAFHRRDHAIIIVVSGNVKIDNRKYKNEFGCKAKMLSPENILKLTGYQIGGVCPFALSDDVEVYLDKSLKDFSTVFPACGSSNSAIELTLDELEKTSHYKKWVDVCKSM